MRIVRATGGVVSKKCDRAIAPRHAGDSRRHNECPGAGRFLSIDDAKRKIAAWWEGLTWSESWKYLAGIQLSRC